VPDGGNVEGPGSQRGVVSQEAMGGAWIWCRARAQHGLKGGEPGQAELQLCSPTEWGLGRLAVLLLDCGVEKPSRV
jgi:hypothetical protein